MSRIEFLERIHVSDDVLAQINEISKNAQNHKAPSCRDSGGYERGDDGPGSHGRESVYKYGGNDMGELKNKGREGVKENQDQYQEIQEGANQALDERNQNIEIMQSLELVDDDDKASFEDGKEQGKVIAEQIAESQMEAPKNEVNSRMESTVSEMKDLEGREKDDVSKVSAMDGNYGGIGSELERKFEDSAAEFNEIATSGEEIQEQSNARIDSIIQNMKEDW